MPPRPLMPTAEIVSQFKAGKSLYALAQRNHCRVDKIEEAIRRWMQVYPEGKR